MRTPIVAGIAAGVALGVAGAAAVGLVTEAADAQSGGQALSQNLESQVEGSNLRSQRGIKQATTVWNCSASTWPPPAIRSGPRVHA